MLPAKRCGFDLRQSLIEREIRSEIGLDQNRSHSRPDCIFHRVSHSRDMDAARRTFPYSWSAILWRWMSY